MYPQMGGAVQATSGAARSPADDEKELLGADPLSAAESASGVGVSTFGVKELDNSQWDGALDVGCLNFEWTQFGVECLEWFFWLVLAAPYFVLCLWPAAMPKPEDAAARAVGALLHVFIGLLWIFPFLSYLLYTTNYHSVPLSLGMGSLLFFAFFGRSFVLYALRESPKRYPFSVVPSRDDIFILRRLNANDQGFPQWEEPDDFPVTKESCFRDKVHFEFMTRNTSVNSVADMFQTYCYPFKRNWKAGLAAFVALLPAFYPFAWQNKWSKCHAACQFCVWIGYVYWFFLLYHILELFSYGVFGTMHSYAFFMETLTNSLESHVKREEDLMDVKTGSSEDAASGGDVELQPFIEEESKPAGVLTTVQAKPGECVCEFCRTYRAKRLRGDADIHDRCCVHADKCFFHMRHGSVCPREKEGHPFQGLSSWIKEWDFVRTESLGAIKYFDQTVLAVLFALHVMIVFLLYDAGDKFAYGHFHYVRRFFRHPMWFLSGLLIILFLFQLTVLVRFGQRYDRIQGTQVRLMRRLKSVKLRIVAPVRANGTGPRGAEKEVQYGDEEKSSAASRVAREVERIDVCIARLRGVSVAPVILGIKFNKLFLWTAVAAFIVAAFAIGEIGLYLYIHTLDITSTFRHMGRD